MCSSEILLKEGEGQRSRRTGQAHRFAHDEVERGQRLGNRRLGRLLEEFRVEEPREERLLVGGNRAHLLPEREGDLRGVPVAAARQAEDPRGKRRRERGVLSERGAGFSGRVEQQADIEPAPEERRRVRARPFDQRPRLGEGAGLEEPVDPCDEDRAAVALALGRVGLGEEDAVEERPCLRDALVGLADDQRAHLLGAVGTPERGGEPGLLR